jgi:hypothetical protein
LPAATENGMVPVSLLSFIAGASKNSLSPKAISPIDQ